jgi:hypothetical protein
MVMGASCGREVTVGRDSESGSTKSKTGRSGFETGIDFKERLPVESCGSVRRVGDMDEQETWQEGQRRFGSHPHWAKIHG